MSLQGGEHPIRSGPQSPALPRPPPLHHRAQPSCRNRGRPASLHRRRRARLLPFALRSASRLRAALQCLALPLACRLAPRCLVSGCPRAVGLLRPACRRDQGRPRGPLPDSDRQFRGPQCAGHCVHRWPHRLDCVRPRPRGLWAWHLARGLPSVLRCPLRRQGHGHRRRRGRLHHPKLHPLAWRPRRALPHVRTRSGLACLRQGRRLPLQQVAGPLSSRAMTIGATSTSATRQLRCPRTSIPRPRPTRRCWKRFRP